MTDTTKAWFERAEGDYWVAMRELGVTDMPVHEVVCFHAHQCIEKLLKTVLVSRGIRPPFTHDLWVLSDLLTKHVSEWSADVSELEDLTRLGTELRYPNMIEPNERATRQDAELCFALCQKYRERLLAFVNWD